MKIGNQHNASQSRVKLFKITIKVPSLIFSKAFWMKTIQFISKVLTNLQKMMFYLLKELIIHLLVFLKKVTINFNRLLEINLLKLIK